MLGKMIRQRRQAVNLTQLAVAQYVGVSKPCICLWESGKRKPGLADLAKLERMFDVYERAIARAQRELASVA